MALTTFGATHAAASLEEAQALVGEITWGANADKAILTVGLATGDLIGRVLGLVAKGGRAVIVSASPILESTVNLSLIDLTTQRKELVGCMFGNANPRFDIPRLLRLYEDKKLKLDELITRTYSLDEINTGYEDMRLGKNIRGAISFA
jgi:S-(hydroxymethyl)glutathione dehydrogenase/alcohol dehydrogenase